MFFFSADSGLKLLSILVLLFFVIKPKSLYSAIMYFVFEQAVDFPQQCYPRPPEAQHNIIISFQCSVFGIWGETLQINPRFHMADGPFLSRASLC